MPIRLSSDRDDSSGIHQFPIGIHDRGMDQWTNDQGINGPLVQKRQAQNTRQKKIPGNRGFFDR
jgi:hypothetical protein